MIHKVISTIGLGILGVDPFTAVYLLSMGLRKEKKSNLAFFFLSYAGFSVLIGAVLSAIFGTAAVDILKSMVPGDNSPFWAVLEFAVSVFILVWVLRRLFSVSEKKEETEKKAVNGTWIKYLSTGVVFAISSSVSSRFIYASKVSLLAPGLAAERASAAAMRTASMLLGS